YVAQHFEGSLPSLRLVLLSGDWIPISLPVHIQSLGKHIQVISLGGATEASIWSIYYPIETVHPTWKSIPYGKPLTNQQFYILDSHLHPVPIGVAGELYIGGDGVARSYFNRPDLTQERFIPNPFSDRLGDRIYKTGDLGRYLPDGNIEFLGRLDHQVKIRGYRIELGEIEAVLTQHPQVREALVIAREDRPGDKYLAAYVIPEKQQVSCSNELRDFLKQRLPDYMVPAIVFLEALPLTPNGKIDRRALPALEQRTQESPTTFVAPRNQLELQLAKLWESVLDIQPIGVRDNFFELGGHSLLATRLWIEIEKLTGKNLPLATLFQAPTIEQLANILSQEGWSLSCSSLMVIQPGGTKPPLFCIHVLGRGLQFFRPLVRYLDPEQPVYGLSTHAANVDEKQAPPNQVEDLAAFYLKEMQSLQPEGPYFLVGVSFGGEVAFEMARLLVAQGQKVALLALLDSINKYAFQPVAKHEQLRAHWSNLLKFRFAYIKKIVLGNIEEFNNRLNRRIQKISCKFYQVMGRPLPDGLQDFTYEMLNRKAAWEYTPQVYPGRVTLFRASDRAASTSVSTRFDPELGWGKLAAGGLEIHDVSGDHLGILEEPHVRGLGEKMRDCIDKALAGL
ncbi:MAG TPA: alpha/beta fold hydrolase, partial [Coleofasciculaceae cyanobacterium]